MSIDGGLALRDRLGEADAVDDGRVVELIADDDVVLAEQGAEAVIPSTTSRSQPIPYSKMLYRQRNLIERMFARLKDFRRIATRYDKLARNFIAGAFIAAAVTWWLN